MHGPVATKTHPAQNDRMDKAVHGPGNKTKPSSDPQTKPAQETESK